MLLKAGIALMSAALLMATGVFAFVFLTAEEPVVTKTEVAEKTPEPTVSYSEPQRIEPEKTQPEKTEPEKTQPKKTEPIQRVKAEEKVKPEPPPDRKAKPSSAPKPAPSPKPKPEPPPEPEPVAVEKDKNDWPAPTGDQVAAANGPRRYGLPTGAVMGLTVKALEIYNAPVFDSNEAWALDAGVRHVPETSMPWSREAQRNVYLEGHRLGYAGTRSHLIFYNLDRLKRGDEVLLKNRSGKRYKYRVSDSFVVSPSDSWVMGQIRGRDMVTLQTCTNAPAYDKRLIVRAERV